METLGIFETLLYFPIILGFILCFLIIMFLRTSLCTESCLGFSYCGMLCVHPGVEEVDVGEAHLFTREAQQEFAGDDGRQW